MARPIPLDAPVTSATFPSSAISMAVDPTAARVRGRRRRWSRRCRCGAARPGPRPPDRCGPTHSRRSPPGARWCPAPRWTPSRGAPAPRTVGSRPAPIPGNRDEDARRVVREDHLAHHLAVGAHHHGLTGVAAGTEQRRADEGHDDERGGRAEPGEHQPAPAAGERPRLVGEAGHDPFLEAARAARRPGRRGGAGRRPCRGCAPRPGRRAARQVAEQRRPLLAVEDVEGQVGGLGPHVVTRGRAHRSTGWSRRTSRTRRRPVRMRVLAVPSGMSSSWPISCAVRPPSAASSSARRCS